MAEGERGGDICLGKITASPRNWQDVREGSDTGKARSRGIRKQEGQGSGFEPRGSQPSLALVILMVSASPFSFKIKSP